MKVIRATQQMLETRTLVIGFQGENLRTQLRIDCSTTFAEYPNATPALAIKPPSGATYPVFVERDGNEVVWDIVANNLALKGDGELQLTFYKDSVIAKTSIGHITVNRSLQIDGEMPDVVATWIENANRKLAEVDAQIVELEGMVDTATDAATRAEQSASTASAKAEQAAGSAATATEKATEATNAAGTATAKAAEAEQSALTATEKANAAAESERIATAKAGDATTAAGTATAKAGQATESAQTATEKAGDASASARAAQESATDAAASATAASASETAAKASETAAGASATQAAQSVLDAGANAQTAMQKAAEASQSATGAAQSEQTATQKAGEAEASAQTAQEAKTAVEQTAEQLADSLEQIAQNTQDIAELDERKANIDGYYPDMTVGNAEQLNSSKFVENSEPYTLRTSGGSSDIGNREYLDAVVGGTLAWNQMVRDEASENSTDFADVVTVTDAVEDAAGVKVKIEPVQGLHGYDHPWPGGGGANKMPALVPGEYTKDGIKAVVDSNGVVTVTGQKNVSSGTTVILPLEEAFTPVAGQYFHLRNSYVNSSIAISRIAGSPTLAQVNRIAKLTSAQIEVTSLGIYVTADVTDTLNFTLQMSIEDSGDVTNWTPYSNICPITGWDGVQVWDDPKYGGLIEWNQKIEYKQDDRWSGAATSDFSLDVNARTVSATMTVPQSRIKKASLPTVKDHVYFLSAQITVSVNNGVALELSRGWTQTPFSLSANSETLCQAVMTPTSENDNYGWVQFFVSSTGTYPCTLQVRDAMLLDLTEMFGEGNEPTTVEEFKALFPADYYPYNAGEITTVSAVNGNPYRHYPITLPSEAGTVYGGELTVNADGSGSLVVDRVEADMGSLNWIYQPNWGSSNTFYTNQGVKIISASEVAKIRCSVYKTVSANKLYFGSDKSVCSNGTFVRISESDYTDAASFKATVTGQQVVYELATPLTYTFTASEIRTLLGTNNVWADTGDLALTYTGTEEHLTLESGKKYLARLSGTDSMLLGSGQEITAAKGTDNVFDLTQMFGTAVADYVYGQGAGFFRKWFGKQLYPYNAGELRHVEGLQSHDMVGFNAFDKSDIKTGVYIADGDGSEISATGAIATGWIPVIGGASYYIKHDATSGNWGAWYNADKAYISGTGKGLRTAPVNAAYLRFTVKNNASSLGSPDTLCINLAHNNSRNGEYEPYEKHSYPLDSTVVLRGIPKAGANGVYWDGDRYLPDGTVERKYGVLVCDGTISYNTPSIVGNYSRIQVNFVNGAGKLTYPQAIASWLDRIVSFSLESNHFYCNDLGAVIIVETSIIGSTAESVRAFFAAHPLEIVYELATPTTETAQPYHSTQWVSDWGTEEFVSTGIVPVGHETRYPANLRDKLQHLPDAASGNGSYLITQTDGQMVLTPFPAPPSTAGNYVLKATVVNGVATYTWEVAT